MFSKARLQEVERAKNETTGLTWLPDKDISEFVKAAILQRLRPDSKLRKNIRLKVPFPISSLVVAGYGADFVDYRKGLYGVIKALFFSRSQDFRAECYMNIRAIKM
jgi:hypothetical protein